MKRGTCKLCQNEADLNESHYLGRALYKLYIDDGELPVVASPSLIIRDQKQIKEYLLCRNCEQEFTKRGENYVMTIINRKDGFGIMESIRKNPMRRVEGDYSVYRASDMRIDTASPAYFALSVIWRGCHVWRTFNGKATGGLRLGSHEEQVRSYLLGIGPYPEGAIVKLSVASDSASQNAVTFPRVNPDQQNARVFTFVVRGIWFDIAIGDELPAYMFQSCCVRSPEKPIFVGDFDRFLIFDPVRWKQTARILA